MFSFSLFAFVLVSLPSFPHYRMWFLSSEPFGCFLWRLFPLVSLFPNLLQNQSLSSGFLDVVFLLDFFAVFTFVESPSVVFFAVVFFVDDFEVEVFFFVPFETVLFTFESAISVGNDSWDSDVVSVSMIDVSLSILAAVADTTGCGTTLTKD